MAANAIELPEEILVTEILSRLPVKSLMRFKSVCKSWSHLFRNQDFIAKHRHYQTIYSNSKPTFIVKHRPHGKDCFSLLSSTIGNDDGVLFISTVVDTMIVRFPAPFTTNPTIFGSVNGLLCLCDNKDGSDLVALWNPATREFKSIPLPLLGSIKVKPMLSNLGFGFDKETNDYKILIFMCNASRRGEVHDKEEVMLYSLKYDSWRKIDSVDVITNYTRSLFNPYMDGIRYWWAQPPGRSDEPLVLSFNFANEVFEQLSLADLGDSMVGHEYDNHQLAIIDEKLSVLNHIEDSDEESDESLETFIAIRSMTEHGVEESDEESDESLETFIAIRSMTEHGVEETWREVNAPLHSKLLYASSISVFFQDKENLALFDASTKQVYNLRLYGMTHSSQVANYTQSLVPLYGREKEDGPRNFYSVFETPKRLHH